MRPDPDLTSSPQEPNRWEPQPGETPRAYQVFAHYRDLGPLRTLRRAAADFYHGHPELPTEARLEALTDAQLGQAKEWSRANGWVERAQAWDLHLDAISRSEQEQHARTMRANYRTIAVNLRNRVHASIVHWSNDGTDGRILNPTEAVRALEVAQRIEAWALEIPDTVAPAAATQTEDARELADVGRGIVAELRLVKESEG